jgi:adenosylcobinamide-phosphate synthase
MYPLTALVALTLDAALGYPQRLFEVIGHPVSWIGRLIAWCEHRWNGPHLSYARRRALGIWSLLVCLGATAAVSIAIALLIKRFVPAPFDLVALGVAASPLIAQRSLYQHVRDVAAALEQEGAADTRRAVSLIVGRDTSVLDEAGVSRAAIESLAENFSDGVVAPLFWLFVGGFPGAALYKTINTADSMIGHRSERYRAFGWAAARLDDVVNLPASRLSALWICSAAFLLPDANGHDALRAVRNDATRHRSPNAGWPEAAMAGALGLRLAGPRVYGGILVSDHWMGDGRAEAGAADTRRALRVYRTACVVQAAVIATIAALTLFW